MRFFKLDGLIDHLTDFIETKVEIYKLEVKEELAAGLSKLVVIILLFCFALFFVLFSSITLGYYLGFLMGNIFYGFLVVSMLYLILFLIFFFLRNRLGLKEVLETKLGKLLKLEK